MKLKLIAGIIVVLDILAIATCYNAWDYRIGPVVDVVVSDRYEVFAEARSGNVTVNPSIHIKCRDRQSIFRTTREVAWIYNRQVTLRMVTGSLVLARTAWGPSGRQGEELLINLDCVSGGVAIRNPNELKVREVLYDGAVGPEKVKLVELNSDQRLFRVHARIYNFRLRDLYIIGARDVQVRRAEEGPLRLDILWECEESPREYEYSNERGIVVLSGQESNQNERSR